MDDKLLEELYLRLKIGLPGIESPKKGYDAKNPDSTATGKYQFTNYWLKEAGEKSIQSFAKKHKNIFSVPKTLEDFKKQPELQEAYFKFYTEKVLYPQTKELYKKNNPLGLTFDEVAATIHYQGFNKAKKQIISGKLFEGSKKGNNNAKADNVTGYKYLEVYNNTLSNYSINNIDKDKVSQNDKDLVNKREKIISDFKKKNKEINSLNVDNSIKESLRKKYYTELIKKGNHTVINNYLKEENEKKKEKVNSLNNLMAVLNSGEMNYQNTINGKVFQSFIIKEENTDGNIEKALKDFPELFNGVSYKKDKDGNYAITGTVESFGERLLNFSKKNGIALRFENKKDFFQNVIDIGSESIPFVPDWLIRNNKKTLNKFYNYFKENVGAKDTLHLNIENNKFEFKESQLIDPKNFNIENTSRSEIWKKKNEELKNNNSNLSSSSKTTPNNNQKNGDDKEETPIDALSFLENRQSVLEKTKGQEFNYGETKKELPVDALMGLTLGLIGNKQAKEAKIPLRTEDVSIAMKNYVAELSQRVKEGLPVEVEASIKNKLADAYTAGLKNIINASAGNRALVLGNQGQLETAKNKGLVNLAIADYQAKEKAFQKYGDVLKYFNEFDTRRNVANHEILYREAKEKQLQGRQLATAGFSKLIDALKHQRENGPGSANDMYRSYLMQNMYGFDPKKKDNGLGDTPGTKSFYDKKNKLVSERISIIEETKNKLQKLSPEQRKIAGKFYSLNQDDKTFNSFLDYVEKNPEIKSDSMNLDAFNKAIEKQDFSFLFNKENKPEIVSDGIISMDPNTLQSLTEEQSASFYDENGVLSNLTTIQ